MALLFYRLLYGLAQVWTWLVIARAIVSFLPPGRYSPFWRAVLNFLWETTEPILRPIRRVLPTAGGLDFSPLVALLLLQFIVRPLLGQLLLG